MLPSKYRLKKRSSFARVELTGKVSQFPSFGLGILDRGDNDPSLFGFVISTKISKLAVTRNRIKRILSDAVRLNYKLIRPGFDVVFLAKPSIVKSKSEDLKKEVERALKDVSLLQNKNIPGN